MKIAVVDDTKIDAQILKKYIDSYLPEKVIRDICVYLSAEEFLQEFRAYNFDVIFLDIFMPGKTGIELAQHIRKLDDDVKIVFCTTSNEFASESYSVNASYYLCKPYTKERFMQMMMHVLPKDRKEKIYIVLPDSQRIIPRNIMYTTYFNHKITIYMENSETIETWLRQSELDELLVDFPYLQTCNRGTIVNFHFVQEYSKNNILLKNGESISISRSAEKKVQEEYEKFIFQRLSDEA